MLDTWKQSGNNKYKISNLGNTNKVMIAIDTLTTNDIKMMAQNNDSKTKNIYNANMIVKIKITRTHLKCNTIMEDI